jgi:hypothetical protein
MCVINICYLFFYLHHMVFFQAVAEIVVSRHFDSRIDLVCLLFNEIYLLHLHSFYFSGICIY